ncbi:hypothetical protein DFQ28_003625 [Apophysomyces sp. BC1034]|nr:hypothetical protein DFQ28_003625 [Apophysomyces sp. BC1034]
MSLNCIADKLLGQYGTQNIPLQWTHKMKKRKRKRERWRVKAFEQEDMRPAIVAFGDADLRPMPGQAPLPIKDFRRILSHKALVVCIDEFRTRRNIYGLGLKTEGDNGACVRTTVSYAILLSVLKQENTIWNRDVNTGKNMRRILREYIHSGCRVDSRPPALQRPARPPQTTQEQLVTGG